MSRMRVTRLGSVKCLCLALIAGVIGLIVCPGARASTIVITFENFVDGDAITDQIPGLIFTNTAVATAGISLNEFDFPPHSGTNVVIDSGGPITIDFSTPIQSFGAYFTYIQRLTLLASSPPGLFLPDVTVRSKFSNNTGTGGDPGSSPNEWIQISGAISSLSIKGDPAGGSFSLDDVTLTSGPEQVVPEPASALLIFFGLIALAIRPFRQAGRV